MSSLSAGKAIYSLLASDETLMATVTKIFPVVVDTAMLPYIVYRRVGLAHVPQKAGMGADTTRVEVNVFTEDYTQGVELAERVRTDLETYGGKEVAGAILRGCFLEASEETWGDDAYVQRLVFNVRIS